MEQWRENIVQPTTVRLDAMHHMPGLHGQPRAATAPNVILHKHMCGEAIVSAERLGNVHQLDHSCKHHAMTMRGAKPRGHISDVAIVDT